MSEEEEEQFENEEQPDQINLESAVEFIQGMIPDLDTETIEQYLIEYQNVQEVIDILMANQESLISSKKNQKKSVSPTKKIKNIDELFGFQNSDEDQEHEYEEQLFSEAKHGNQAARIEDYFYADENQNEGEEEEEVDEDEDNAGGLSEQTYQIQDRGIQYGELSNQKVAKRDDKKSKSERIFDLEDNDCGDFISMDDIRRSSEQKQKVKQIQQEKIDDVNLNKFEALANDDWFNEPDTTTNKNNTQEIDLLDLMPNTNYNNRNKTILLILIPF